VYVNQTNLNVKFSEKMGGGSRGPAKNLVGAMAHPATPLEPSLWRYYCSVTHVTRQWRSYHDNFSFNVT